ncbi:hypothetical protein EI555_016543, partial [Monodon monoceros]
SEAGFVHSQPGEPLPERSLPSFKGPGSVGFCSIWASGRQYLAQHQGCLRRVECLDHDPSLPPPKGMAHPSLHKSLPSERSRNKGWQTWCRSRSCLLGETLSHSELWPGSPGSQASVLPRWAWGATGGQGPAQVDLTSSCSSPARQRLLLPGPGPREDFVLVPFLNRITTLVRCRGLWSFPSRGRVPLLSVERELPEASLFSRGPAKVLTWASGA